MFPWTHFHVGCNGIITLFNIDTCECCGETVQQPNSVTSKESPAKLKRIGLVERDELPVEQNYNEELGHGDCDSCFGQVPEEEDDSWLDTLIGKAEEPGGIPGLDEIYV